MTPAKYASAILERLDGFVEKDNAPERVELGPLLFAGVEPSLKENEEVRSLGKTACAERGAFFSCRGTEIAVDPDREGGNVGFIWDDHSIRHGFPDPADHFVTFYDYADIIFGRIDEFLEAGLDPKSVTLNARSYAACRKWWREILTVVKDAAALQSGHMATYRGTKVMIDRNQDPSSASVAFEEADSQVVRYIELPDLEDLVNPKSVLRRLQEARHRVVWSDKLPERVAELALCYEDDLEHTVHGTWTVNSNGLADGFAEIEKGDLRVDSITIHPKDRHEFVEALREILSPGPPFTKTGPSVWGANVVESDGLDREMIRIKPEREAVLERAKDPDVEVYTTAVYLTRREVGND